MELETINKLYLELSQIATAKTKRELDLFKEVEESNGLLRSAFQIAERNGFKTNWDAWREQLSKTLNRQHRLMFPEHIKNVDKSN
jgi:hypothetical protein